MLFAIRFLVTGAFVALALSVGQVAAAPEVEARTGSVTGRVIDAETQQPLIGATVEALTTGLAMPTDEQGSFHLEGVPVGSFALRASSVGYNTVTRTDVIVRSGRITFVELELHATVTEVEGVTVSTGYFSAASRESGSATSFSGEEVRRAPGSAGDVSRIMFVLPSVAKVNDNLNNLIVRGGNPIENSFYLDNIEIPNINHYPLFGTSGGPISLLQTDFISDVSFSAGGFSAAYGDRLSSIMSLKFREGNRKASDFQLEMNFAGLGAIGEGPINNGRGSWMAGVRRSYLDLLVEAIGTGVVPKYSDYQGKIVYDLTPSHQITALGVGGIDYIDFDYESSVDEGNVVYGRSDGHEYAAGVNWRYLWGASGFSNTSVSLLGVKTGSDYFRTGTRTRYARRDDVEQTAQLRNVNFYRASQRHEFEFGVELKQFMNDYDYYVAEDIDVLGDTIPEITITDNISTPRTGVFASYISRPLPRLRTTVGARFDYVDFTGRAHVAPRMSLAYQISERTTLTGAVGRYYQTLPLILLLQDESHRSLADPQATHYIAGIERLLTDNTMLTLEGYYKDYRNFPVDPTQPELFITDEVIYGFYFANHPELTDQGRARSYGVEATLQKKLVAGVYGLASAAWFRAQYRDYNGVWRNRVFDNRVTFNIEGGYKPNEKWEFSLRWVYAGGAPHTPLDLAASQDLNRTVFDRTRINEARYPDYHSLNIRADRRFQFSGSNMILFFSIWNAYNRENVALYYWNEVDRVEDFEPQWGMLPVIGLEFEF